MLVPAKTFAESTKIESNTHWRGHVQVFLGQNVWKRVDREKWSDNLSVMLCFQAVARQLWASQADLEALAGGAAVTSNFQLMRNRVDRCRQCFSWWRRWWYDAFARSSLPWPGGAELEDFTDHIFFHLLTFSLDLFFVEDICLVLCRCFQYLILVLRFGQCSELKMTFVDQLLSLCGAAGCGELSVSATSQSEPCISWGPQPVEMKESWRSLKKILNLSYFDITVLFCMDGQKKTMSIEVIWWVS